MMHFLVAFYICGWKDIRLQNAVVYVRRSTFDVGKV